MRREEEIAAAFYDYSDALKLSTFGDFEYIDIQEAFEEGAEWSDNHPKNVWHDAIEIPRMNHKNIIYQTNYCSLFNVHIAFVPTCLRSGKITSYSWNEFVKDVNMRRWAYTDDLFPKGSEK